MVPEPESEELYPLALRVTGRRVVVGGGPVAARRAASLAAAGADVTVIAPEACEDVPDLLAAGRVALHRRPYRTGDLTGAWLVHTATGDGVVDDQVAADADVARIWCVHARQSHRGSAVTPAVARAAGVQVSVTAADGRPDPGRATRIRDAVAAALDSGALPVRRRRPATGPGRVDIVGGGPGDPGLITVRARELLARADVVVVDRLAPRGLLADLDPDVEVVDVGKAPGHHLAGQDEINAVLVDRARRGARVVRLKGGDPYVLGRGGEEVLACRAAGIEVTVTPGVTSAVAVPAVMGVPVTHRGTARSFTVVTGHDGLDPACLPRRGTLVILMGVTTLDRTTAVLLADGRDPATPVAVLEDAFGPHRRRIVTTLADAATTVREAGVRSPAVVVVGEVAGLAEDLAEAPPQLPDPVVLVAHGSRDPASGQVNAAVAAALRQRLPGTEVVVSQLDHAGPRPHEALDALAAAGHRRVRLQPLLFTPAYHVTVDLPQVLQGSAAVAGGTVRTLVQAPLVTHPRLLDALDRRLTEAGGLPTPGGVDALVLASAGTSSAPARARLAGLAAAWGARHGVPAVAAFASAAEPRPGEAVAQLVAAGHRVAVGSLFLGPGFLPGRARESALAAGALVVADPVADAPELLDVLVDRYRTACPAEAACRSPRCDFGPDCPAVATG